mgnify:CR=1 FL=1
MNHLKRMLSQQLNVESPSLEAQIERKMNQRMTSQGMSAAKKDEAQIEILEQLANQEGMYNSCSAKILNVMKE